jgi:MFS family permease
VSEETAPPDPAVPHATHGAIVATEELEHGLRERPATIWALLLGTTLMRIGAYGSGLVVAFVLPDVFLPHHLEERHRAYLVGALAATQALSEMVFAPFLARWADRVGRSRVLVGAPVLGVVAMVAAALIPHPGTLFAVRFIEGVASAAFVPTALGTIAAATSRDVNARANASGAFEAATLVGIAGGFALGGLAHVALGRSVFYLLAVCYLAAAVICVTLVPRVPPLPVSPVRTILRAITGPGPVRSFLPAWMGTFALLAAFAANLPSLMRRQADGSGLVDGQQLVHTLDEKLVSTALVGWIVLLVVGIALWTPFLARLGSARTMRLTAPGAWVLAAGLLITNHLGHGEVWVAVPFSIAGVLWLAGFGPAAVAYLAECSETFAADRSALMAFYTVTLAAGGLVGDIVGGLATGLAHADGLFLFGIAVTVFTYFSLGPVVRYERALLHEIADESAAPPG